MKQWDNGGDECVTLYFLVHVITMRSGGQGADLDSTWVREQPCAWSLTRRILRLTLHKRANGSLRPLWDVYNSKVKKYFLPDIVRKRYSYKLCGIICSLSMVSPNLIVEISVKALLPSLNIIQIGKVHYYFISLPARKKKKAARKVIWFSFECCPIGGKVSWISLTIS